MEARGKTEIQKKKLVRDSISYKIVRFINTEEVTTVPETWLLLLESSKKLQKCAYPMKESDYQKLELVRKKSKPKAVWDKYDVEVIGTASTLIEARWKERIASDNDSSCDVDAEYMKQKKEAHKHEADKRTRKNLKRKRRDPDFTDNGGESSTDSSNSDEEDIPDSALPQAPKESIFVKENDRFDNNLKEQGLFGDESGFYDMKSETLNAVSEQSSQMQNFVIGEESKPHSSGLHDTADDEREEEKREEEKIIDNDRDFLKMEENENSENTDLGTSKVINNINTTEISLTDIAGGNKKSAVEDDQKWMIVRFSQTNGLSAVPSVWLTKDKNHCNWPPTDFHNVTTQYVHPRTKPGKEWTIRAISEIVGSKETWASAWDYITEQQALGNNNNNKINKVTMTSNILINNKMSINDTLRPKKTLSELTDEDIEKMNSRDMLTCTLYGYRDISISQIKMMNHLKMQSIDRQTTCVSYSLSAIRRQFPKKNLRSLMDLEDDLSDENKHHFKRQVSQYLKDVGGSSGHKYLQNMLARVITDTVASHFNYTGKGSKKAAFGELRIWNIVKDLAVEKFRNVEGDNYDFCKAVKTCSDWLKFAPFRGGNKKRNQKVKHKTLNELASAEKVDQNEDADDRQVPDD